MRVLVTGGAGFIGSHIVDGLLKAGHTVRVLDNLDRQVHPAGEWPDYLSKEAEAILGDVRDAAACDSALKGMDAVYHEAAAVGVGQSMYEIERYVDVNSRGAAVLLENILAHRDHLQKMIVASSMSIYGEGRYTTGAGELFAPRPRPEAQLEAHRWEVEDAEGGAASPTGTDEAKPLHPTSVYAVTKRDHEELFISVGSAYRIPVVALRYFNVFGPRQALSNPYTGVAAIFSSRLIAGQRPVIYEDGYQSRDFVHVSDIVQANLKALSESGADYEAVNVGTGRAVAIRDIATTLATALGKSDNPDITGQFRAGDIRHCYADISKARQLLGYEPRVTLESGMTELVSWVSKQTPDDRFEDARRELEARNLIS